MFAFSGKFAIVSNN